MKGFLFYLFLLPSLLMASQTHFSAFTSYDHGKTKHPFTDGLTLQSLVLENQSHTKLPQEITTYQGVVAYKMTLPGNIRTLKRYIRPFLHAPLDKKLISEIREAVLQFYVQQGHPFVQILVPKQNVKKGMLRLIVKEASLGEITLEGEGSESKLAELAKKQVSLRPGEPIDTFNLNEDLFYLNKNPFFDVDVIYYPGKVAMTTNIALRVQKKKSLRLFVGMDNTGNDITGNNRAYTGISLGNLFNTPQTLSYQFISASDAKKLTSHILDYNALLPWKHTLRLFSGLSFINAPFYVPNITPKFTTKGYNVQASIRYEMPLKGIYRLLHQMQTGFDFKRTNNNILFIQQFQTSTFTKAAVNLTQLSAIYSLGYDTTLTQTAFSLEGYFSPGSWLPSQSKEDYNKLRIGSQPLYAYARSSFKTSLRLRQGTFVGKLRGQLATTNLLPSETFGLGGMRTVRGYKERIINGDNAFLLNCEYHTPHVSPMRLAGAYKKVQDSFTLIGFFDYGIMSLHKPVSGEKKSQYLSSIGTGLRYYIGPYVSVTADWGYELHRVPGDPNGQRFHFSFLANY